MAINKFKGLLARSRPSTPGSRTPRTPRTLQIPNASFNYQPAKPALPEFTWNQAYVPPEPEHKSPEPDHEQHSTPPPAPDSRPRHKSVAEEAADIVEARKAWKASNVHPNSDQTRKGGEGGTETPPGEKGHAHEPTDHSPRLLGIGLGGRDEFNHEETPADIVSDSPTGIDFNIYDTAFEAEIERIRAENRQRGPDATGAGAGTRPPKKTTYLTRFVNEKEKYFGDDSMILEAGRSLPGLASSGMSKASAATARALGRMHIGGGGSKGDDAATSPSPEAAAAAAAAISKDGEAKTKEDVKDKGEGEEETTPAPATNTGAGQEANNNNNNANKTAEEQMTLSESYEDVKQSVHKFADVVASTMQAKLEAAKGGGGAAPKE